MRKLACACLAFFAAVFLANYILPSLWLPVCAALFALSGGALCFLREKWLRGLIIVCFAAAVGFCCFYVRQLRTARLSEEYAGKTVEITAELLDYPQCYDDYCRAEVFVEGGGLPRVKAILYDNGATIGGARPGQSIACTVKISSAGLRYGEKYDYYYSRGFYLILSSRSDITVSDGGCSFRVWPQRLRRAIADAATEIFPQDTAPFIKALTLGDKSELYNDSGLYLSLSRAGLMHTVAVSGMHIAFLIGFLQLLLGSSRRSSLACIALLWAFVLITGSGHSAVRAGFMQSVLLAAPLVRRENDPVTSLSAVLAGILAVNPYAAASVSLQLSFAAMAGMILFGGRIYQALTRRMSSKKLRRMLGYPLKALSCSLAVMVFTVPLCAVHFGYVSVLSPLANILCLWAVSLCFCGACAAYVLGALLPAAGAAAAWLISWLARYIFAVSGFISAMPFAAVYLNSASTVLWLLLTYVLAAAAAFSGMRVWEKLAVPAALSAAALALALLTAKLDYSGGGGVISFLDVGQGQCICAFSGDSTVVVDCGGSGFDAAGETAGGYLAGCVRGDVDILVLTHLHADHCGGVAMLAEMADIKTLVIPGDADDGDGMLAALLRIADEHGIELLRVDADASLSAGGIGLEIYVSPGKGDENERGLMAKLSIGEYDLLVTGDASKASEHALLESHDISSVELLAVGHHGSRYSSAGDFLRTIGADTAVISVGYNTYGHPTYETLERLDAYGYNVYRTDLSGTIEFRIGR